MTRLAYICADPGVPVFGSKGCSVHVQEVIRALRRAGCDVELFVRNAAGERPRDLHDLRVHKLPAAPGKDSAQREQALLDSNDQLREALDDAGPLDLVYERYALWSHAGMEWAAERGVPGLLEVNAPLIEEQSRYRQLTARAAAEESTRRAFAAAAALLPVSNEVAAYLEKSLSHDGRRIHMVSNGVDVRRFDEHVTPAVPRTTGMITVGFVGTLKPWHGVDLLIEAAAGIDGVRLLMVGDGPEFALLHSRARRCGFNDETALFTGAVDPERVPSLLASMDIAVAPYPALEEFYFSPLKIVEYMAAGKAIVASNIGQIRETLVDGQTALLCKPGQVSALAAALRRLRDDADLRGQLGRQARVVAEREHTWDAVAGRILSIAASNRNCVQEACR